jgi:hypothetical protein
MHPLAIGLLLIQIQLATASGVVTKPGSNEPLPGATVMLTPAVGEVLGRGSPQNSRIRFTVSEDDGRFMIRDIEPGDYRLQVQSPLYGGASYGQRRPDGPGAVLTIAAGQRLAELKLSMAPTGTIAGRVTGQGGEPLAHATVQAMKYAYQDGNRTLAVVQTTTTDDRGEYRLFWLYSGKYVVVASLLRSPVTPGDTTPPVRPGGTALTSDMPFRGPLGSGLPFLAGTQLEATSLVKRILDDGTIREESWMPTYYPSTTDRTQAAAVEVAAGSTAGSTVTGINISLGPSPVQKIRGRVTGGIQTAVTLTASGQGATPRLTTTNASPVDGSFEFAGVVPGPYTITAQDRNGLVAAPMAVLVADRDVENLAIAVAPTITLSARLRVEGTDADALDPLSGIVGTLRQGSDTVARGTLRQPNALIGPGNVLTWQNVPPGEYQLNIQQPALQDNSLVESAAERAVKVLKRQYIKSIRFGREDAFDTVRVSPGMAGIVEVVLTAATGSVDGVALGRTGDPATHITVVLVPTNGRRRASLYQTLVTGSDGRFRFQEIPPGDYKLFAWDDVETGAWQDAEFIAPFESRGRAMRVSEGSKDEVQLNVIYNP